MEPVSGINPDILKWARKTAGYSLEDVAQIMKKSETTLELWESGGDAPTYAQLEKLAYTVYKRPIAIFFFPHPPEEADPKRSFRTIPQLEIEKFSPDTRLALRQARAMQIALKELNDGANPALHKIFRDIQIKIGEGILETTSKVRRYIGIPLKEQISWKTNEEALRIWRHSMEEQGIFIFKRSFKQKYISGFCFLDNEFPIIYLNNSTSETRQIFTIFHELAHLLMGVNGITLKDDTYINSLSGEERQIEIFCNRFAAEFLAPEKDLEPHISGDQPLTDRLIANLAKRYKVSREVILRKLLDKGQIPKDYYEKRAKEWAQDYERSRKGKGGDYYATQIMYLGESFLNLAFRKYYQGRLTQGELADYLNTKARYIPNFEQVLMAR